MATPEGRLFPVPPSLPRTVPLSLQPARDPGDLRARAQAVRRMPLVLGAAGHVRHCGQGDGKARATTSDQGVMGKCMATSREQRAGGTRGGGCGAGERVGDSRVYGSGCLNSASFASPSLTIFSTSRGSLTYLFASNSARIAKPRSMKRSRCTAQFCRFLSECRYSFITRIECTE